MHPGRSERRILLVALMMVAAGVAIWLSGRGKEGGFEEVVPETEGHQQVRGAVLHNVSRELVEEVLRIEAQEKRVAETVWAKEMLAQDCGRTFEALWDELNATSNKLELVPRFPVDEVRLAKWDSVEELPHGIRVMRSSGGERSLQGAEWKAWVDGRLREGWKLEQVEFRHNAFDASEEGEPAKSRFYFAANLLKAGANADEEERVSLEGDLEVEWGAKGEDEFWRVAKVDASGLIVKQRLGEPAFRLAKDEVVMPREQERWIDPLVVYDLDGDGRSEVVLVARNLVFELTKSFAESKEAEAQGALREGEGAKDPKRQLDFKRRELCRFPEEFIGSAVFGDVTGDGNVDLVCAKWEGVFVFDGASGGLFPQKARLAWKAKEPIQRAMVMTSGDVDGDGDLDLYLGQYKDPYEGGVTPRPFYDANDGYPGYLLVNQGGGIFVDGTVAAGLEKKRNRRTFSASLVDLDRDEDLDLMVVSDFAGMDFYANDGKGKFSDVTTNWVVKGEERLGFGMSHLFADFNRDGLMDVLMMGMTSPTMDRLRHMGLMRSRNPQQREMEVAMTYGNRLLFGKQESGFTQGEMSHSIARAGWAWGCASLDFDNDGWEDVYVMNGFQSRGRVQDLEGEYWLHDRFLESEMGAEATDLYFKSAGARIRERVRSFGGHDRNRLYWNQAGTNFLEIGYLMGVSVVADSRNIVADDLDGDERVDLVMTTMEVWPKEQQTLKVFLNRLKTGQRQKGANAEASRYATGSGFRSQRPAKPK